MMTYATSVTRLLVVMTMILVVATACDGWQMSMSPVPLVQRGIWIGAYAPPAPWESMDAVHDLERSLGRRLDVVHIYKAWGDGWGAYGEQTMRELTQATTENRRAMITWEPWVHTLGVDQPNFRLANIARGDYDGYLESWAAGLRAFPGTVYLRPMHEMNGNWYPWAGQVNQNTSTDYVAAWRHMHDLFDREGARNVRWIWCPYALDVPTGNRFEEYYPGDRYVDILGLDIYNWGVGDGSFEHPNEMVWRDVDELLNEPYQRLTRLGSQPVWLTEVGTAEQGGDKATWLRTLLESPGYDRIRALVWFHANKERDWRITSSPRAVRAVASALTGTVPATEAEAIQRSRPG
jgi:beta-mannanase